MKQGSHFYKIAMTCLHGNRLDEAEAAFAQAISCDEKNALYWYQLALLWDRQGKSDQCRDALQMSHQLAPNDVDPLESLGNFYYRIKDFKTASIYFMQAYKIDPNRAELAHRLSISLYQSGDSQAALKIMLPLVLAYPNNHRYLSDVTEMFRRVKITTFDPTIKETLTLCLGQENLKFMFLAAAWATTLLLDPSKKSFFSFCSNPETYEDFSLIASQLNDPFLCLGLEKVIVRHGHLEILLSNLRSYFLLRWNDYTSWPFSSLRFLSSLAVQGWFNDFVFYRHPTELSAFKDLQMFLRSKISNQDKFPDNLAPLLALYACYAPLGSLLDDRVISADTLDFSSVTQSITREMIVSHLINPQHEACLITTIPSFTNIEDSTSQAVQRMYEQRPYPRWKNKNLTPPTGKNLTQGESLHILVAGCGTGQEPTTYACALPKSHVTAIDLSKPSIAYGMRMAESMGISKRITFLHGDLINAAQLDRKFDFVASSGVLHHLKNPDQGLESILHTLKPGGRLSISLYSKAARDYLLNPASAYIHETHYSSEDDDIRKFRRDILLMPHNDPRARCTHTSDFFSLAECNDLLFHVQEHRYTPHMIWDMAKRYDLVPFHILMTPDRQQQFQSLFPGQSPLHPDLLEKFEVLNPTAFIEMFKLYFYRRGEDHPHPLDNLIRRGFI